MGTEVLLLPWDKEDICGGGSRTAFAKQGRGVCGIRDGKESGGVVRGGDEPRGTQGVRESGRKGKPVLGGRVIHRGHLRLSVIVPQGAECVRPRRKRRGQDFRSPLLLRQVTLSSQS